MDGLRENSLYYKAYYQLRQPLIDLMFEGVAWDSASAEKEREQLVEKKAKLKQTLDSLTGGFRLYTVYKRRSKLLCQLYAEQAAKRAARKTVGARSERGKALGAELKEVQERIKAVRGTDLAVEFEIGESISGKRLKEYLFEKLQLPASKKRRKESGKVTTTVDDVALRKLDIKFGDRSIAGGSLRELFLAIKEHQRAGKLISTYLNPNKLLSPTDGRFHSVYKCHGTQTGRLSSGSDPWDYGGNSQNIDREFKWLYLPD